MNNRGVITAKLVVLMSAVIMIFSLLLSSLFEQFQMNQKKRNEQMIAESILANFNTYLYIHYGLYGMAENEEVGYIKHSLFKEQAYDIVYEAPLIHVETVQEQIKNLMKVRMPVNYVQHLLEKLDVIKKSKSSQEILDKKLLLDGAMSEMAHLMDERISLALIINGLTREKIEILMNEVNFTKVLDELSIIQKANDNFFEKVIEMASKKMSIEALIETTKTFILEDEKALDVVKNQVLNDISDTVFSWTSQADDLDVSPSFKVFMHQNYPDVDETWYQLLEVVYENSKMISNFKDTQDWSILLSYQMIDTIKKDVDIQAKEYYEIQKKRSEMLYKPSIDGRKISMEVPYTVSEKGEFWKAVLLDVEKMSVGLMINEYLMSTLKSFAVSSSTDVDYFSKYERASYFLRGEIEYVLMGETSEILNVSKTLTMIYGIRVVLNGLHVYTDREKLLLSESIGWGVAGWTGFGAPLVSNIVRASWAIGESFVDMKNLTEGKDVPFYKIYSSQWQLDLGLFYEKKSLPFYMAVLDFSYHDYLRIMLLTVSSETKIKRLINLIELNYHEAFGSFILRDMYTKVRVNEYEKSYYE